MTMTDPRQELQKVVDGDLAFINALHLAKQSGYHLFRVKEIALEMGLYVESSATQIGSYRVSLPPVEG